ncbi:hypothetical protein N8I71_17540 [Roseibacterium sp. SDUM158016]|nr:hypothetical protein [Roseibacterium sp. SDUM158016]MCU4654647.1 hypothetical protein [Roseibacterium sp. SDUM158016]
MSERAVRVIVIGLAALILLGALGMIAFAFFLDAAMKDAFSALPVATA